MKIALTGDWQLRNTKKQSYIRAKVPGDVFLAHLEKSLIADPFYGANENDAYKLAENDFEYIKKIVVDAELLQADEIFLIAEQIDTLAHIFINDILVEKVDNAHCIHRIRVKEHLVAGENTLKIVLFSPLKYIRYHNANDRMPKRIGQTDGVNHIRKPQCHFGWDWGINLPIMGITRDIYLQSYTKARINNINITQTHKNIDSNTDVELDIDIDVTKLSADGDYSTEILIKQPNGKELNAKDKGTQFNFTIPNAELWWTKELSGSSSQPLYEIEAKVYCNDSLCDSMHKRIGLRQIELINDKDKYGSNYQFVLNGVPIFAKGANFIPMDAMITRAEGRHKEYIDAMLDANMNIVRIWGGGYYQTDAFYNYCDEKGLLVWQDFAFACMPYPFYNKAFLANVVKEVRCNVERLKHHPSLLVWCGNNEIELITASWIHRAKLIKWTKKFFYDILPYEIKRLDPTTPYAPGSPTSFEFMKKVNSENYGSKHIWSVWHGLRSADYYRKLYPRFASEFGLQSMPSMDMINAFAEEKDFSLSSAVMKSHQKCMDGNDKMLFYLADEFLLPNDFALLPYLTGLTQSYAICGAIEHMRRNKGRCNGAIYWQLNDCWGASSWSSMDYLGVYKPLQYRVKDAFAPISVSLEKHKKSIDLYLINDLAKEQNVFLEYGIVDFYGNDLIKVHLADIPLDMLSLRKVNSIDTSFLSKEQKRESVFYARLYQNGKLIMQKTATFVKDKKLNLSPQDIQYNIRAEKGEVFIDLLSQGFARQVEIDIPELTTPLSDNYFDLLPKEDRCVSFKTDKEIPLNSIKVNCVNNIADTKTAFAGIALRIRVQAKIINLLSSLLYLVKK